MNFIISGKNIEVTPGLKEAIEQKLGKLERYFTPETEIIVTLSVEKGRQKIEVTIPVKGSIIRSEQTSSDMYVSIDLVEEVIERQLRKYKNKLVAKSQGHPTAAVPSGSIKKEFIESDDESSDDDEIRIVRTKKFGIKPMFPEDACIQMELLAARLNGVSPLAKLGQGYAYVSAEDGTRIRSTADVAEKSLMKIYLKDGYVKAQALEVTHGKGTDA